MTLFRPPESFVNLPYGPPGPGCRAAILGVPYDCGITICRHPAAHRAAMTVAASYLVQAAPGTDRDPVDWNPEFSRRARGVPVYAALASLEAQPP